MKTKMKFSGALMIFLFLTTNLLCQNDRYQMYVVHEDHINEGMMEKHHKADKELIEAARQYNISNMSWIAFQASDNRVMYLTPISGMKDLDKFFFDDLQAKMGDEEFNKLFDSYDGTYSKHGDYIINLDKELSYMPEGITQTPEGQNYRELTYYWIPPGKEEEAKTLAEKVKELYTRKKAPVHYRLYKSGFGNMGNYYMVAVAAKDAAHLEELNKKNAEVLGEEGKKVMQEVENFPGKKEIITGYLKPEISYLSSN